jgi:hypothetical protein
MKICIAFVGCLLVYGGNLVLAKDTFPIGSVAYYKPKSTDGEPVSSPPGCGSDGKRVDAFRRDLGRGISTTVIPAYDGAKLLSVNLIFRYGTQGALKLSPERIDLHVLPDRAIPPRKALRAAPVNADDLFYEEAYLEYSVKPEEAEHIELVIPDGAVIGDGDALRVAPVRFDRAGQSASPRKVSPCFYSSGKPAPAVAKAESPVPGAAVKSAGVGMLAGTWVADAAATEKNLKAATSLPGDEFGMLAGTAMMMFGLVYEIGDGTIKVRLYDTDARLSYRLAPEQKDKGKPLYKVENPQGAGDDLLTVVDAGGGTIKFVSQNPATNYVAFKRVKLDPKNGQRDKMAAMQSVQEMFARLQPKSQ